MSASPDACEKSFIWGSAHPEGVNGPTGSPQLGCQPPPQGVPNIIGFSSRKVGLFGTQIFFGGKCIVVCCFSLGWGLYQNFGCKKPSPAGLGCFFLLGFGCQLGPTRAEPPGPAGKLEKGAELVGWTPPPGGQRSRGEPAPEIPEKSHGCCETHDGQHKAEFQNFAKPGKNL